MPPTAPAVPPIIPRFTASGSGVPYNSPPFLYFLPLRTPSAAPATADAKGTAAVVNGSERPKN